MSDAKVPEKKKRGFAVLSPERVREIATAGGNAAQKSGKAHRFSKEEARAAGRKGGNATSKRKNEERATTAEPVEQEVAEAE